MNFIPDVLPLAWTLVHFIWQGALIALVLGVALNCVPRARSGLRYWISCIAMLTMGGACLVTFWLQQTEISKPLHGLGAGMLPAIHIAATGSSATSGVGGIGSGFSSPSLWSQVLVGAWIVGALVSVLRLALSLLKVRRLRRNSIFEVPVTVQSLLHDLSLRMGIRGPVAIFQSGLVAVPSVIGWLKPLILLPPATLAGLSPGQLEAVLLHELAHIRRHDYLVNCLQRIVCCLLFYHPAVWWVSDQMRQERENCCDDLAIENGADPKAYARMLLTLEEIREAQEFMVLGMAGGLLLERIQRILGIPSPSQPGGFRRRILVAFGAVAVLVTAAISFVDAGAGGSARYESTLRFVVRNPSGGQVGTVSSDKADEANGYDPYRLQTVMETMLSSEVMKSLADRVAGGVFGQTLAAGATDRTEIVLRLKKRISIRQIRNTSVIEVVAKGGSPDEARAIATALGGLILERESSQSGLQVESRGVKELRERCARQEEAVAVTRARLDAVVRELGMPEMEVVSGSITMETLKTFERQRADLEIKCMGLEAALEQIQKSPDAAGRVQSDPLMVQLAKQRVDLEAEMVVGKQDLAAEHPVMRGLRMQLDRVHEQIEERRLAVLAGMKSELQVAQIEQRALETRIKQIRKAAVDLEAGRERVLDARKALDFELSRLVVLQRQIAQELVNHSGRVPRLDLIESASPGRRVPLFGHL